MAKKARARAAARKMREAWKAKQWYRIVAPDMFNGAELGETPAREPEMLIGRVSEVSYQDLTGDFTKAHIKLYFKINSIKGTDAGTEFIGHGMTSDYLRRLTRRRNTKIDDVVDVRTKDGYKIRIKTISISLGRISSSHQHLIRIKMEEVVRNKAAVSTMTELIKASINGELPKEIAKECKKIHPLKRVEVRKSEILEKPKITREELMEEKSEEESLKELETIEGVGPAKAKLLYDAGYRSIEDIKKLSLEELIAIEKLGEATAKKIYSALHPEENEQ